MHSGFKTERSPRMKCNRLKSWLTLHAIVFLPHKKGKKQTIKGCVLQHCRFFKIIVIVSWSDESLGQSGCLGHLINNRLEHREEWHLRALVIVVSSSRRSEFASQEISANHCKSRHLLKQKKPISIISWKAQESWSWMLLDPLGVLVK